MNYGLIIFILSVVVLIVIRIISTIKFIKIREDKKHSNKLPDAPPPPLDPDKEKEYRSHDKYVDQQVCECPSESLPGHASSKYSYIVTLLHC